MKKAITALVVFGLTIAITAEMLRDKGLSLHMLPQRVAKLSGQKWGFTVSSLNRTIQSANELREYFTSLPPEMQDNGIWIVTTDPLAYSEMEEEVLEDVKAMCISNNIPLFICRGAELPNGWQRIDGAQKK